MNNWTKTGFIMAFIALIFYFFYFVTFNFIFTIIGLVFTAFEVICFAIGKSLLGENDDE